MTPKVWVFAIAWNEAVMMPWFLRHYSSFADKIVIFDENSTDGTRDMVKAFPKAELRDWPHYGLDDQRFIEAVNNWYKEARGHAEWVMWPDIDEILHHPDPLGVLAAAKEDVLPARGYAMISPGLPNGSEGQIYETFNKGIPQPNYSKWITWRADADVQHIIGRHGKPKTKAKVAEEARFSLLHYHYFGAEYTAARNRRNYARCRDKRFAWNYEPTKELDANQAGTVAWVQQALQNNTMQEVVSTGKAFKLHFGSGGKNIEGWRNFDIEVDLRKPLPFPNESASHILAEHVIEHITHQHAWSFMEECLRVLVKGGVARIAIPDFARLSYKITDEYRMAVKAGGHGDGSIKSCLRATVFEHGHQAVWSQELLMAMLQAVGFQARPCGYGESDEKALVGVEQHWKTVGLGVAKAETSVVEGVKP